MPPSSNWQSIDPIAVSKNLDQHTMIPTFEIQSRTIEFSSLSGEVLASDKRSETHLSSQGGGGYIGPYGGTVTAPQITSQIITKHEFWIKSSDGREHAVSMSSVEITLRPGQFISLLLAGENGKSRWYIALLNHNTKENTTILTAEELLAYMKIKIQMTGLSFCVLVLGSLLSIILGLPWVGFPLAISFVIFRIVKGSRLLSAQTAALQAHIRQACLQLGI